MPRKTQDRPGRAELLAEIAALRTRVGQLEAGEVKRRVYLESVLECAPDAIVAVDADRRILEWNQGAETLFGWTAAEAIGRELDELVAAPDAHMLQQARAFTERTLNKSQVFPTEAVRYRRDGTPIDVMLASSPIMIDDELLGLVAVYTDISGRKRAERDVKQRSQYLETLQRINATLRSTLPLQQVLETIARGAGETLNYAGAFIVLPDEGAECLRLGAAWGEQFLNSGIDFKDMPVTQFRLPLTVEGNPLVGAYLSGELQTWSGTPKRVVLGIEPAIAPEQAIAVGKALSSRLAIYVPLCIGRRTVGVLVAFSARSELGAEERDVLIGLADQAGLAIESARRFEEMGRLKAFNESIVQQMAEGIALEDADGRFIFVNAAATAMLGYSEAELLGQHRRMIFPADQLALLEAADDRRRQGQANRYQVDLLRQDGSRLPVLVSGSPRFDAAGRFIGTMGVFSDISERMRGENATARRAREMAALYETSLEINSQRDLATLLPAIVKRAAGLLGMGMGSLYLLEPDGETLQMVVAHGLPAEVTGTKLRLGEGLSGRAAQSGQPLMTADYRDWHGRAAVYETAPFRRILAVPLKIKGEVVGVIDVTDDEKTGPVEDDEIRLLSLFADQAAIAVENARLYEQAQQQLKALQVLFDASTAVSSSLDAQRVLHTTSETIRAALPSEGCAISYWDVEQGALVMLYDDVGTVGIKPDAPGTLYPLANFPASRQVLQSRQPLQVRIGDPEADQAEVALMRSQGIKGMLMIPLVARDEVIGLLEMLEYSSERVYTPAEIGLCQTLANQLAATLENVRLFEAEHQQRALAEALRRATAAVSSTLDLDQVLDRILEQVSIVFGGDANSVLLIEDGGARPVRWRGYDRFGSDEAIRSIVLDVATTPTYRQVFETGQPLVVPDTMAYPGWIRIPATAWVRCHSAAPIRVRDQIVGFLVIDSATPGFFNASHGRALQAFADSASVAIGNARLYAETLQRNRELALLNRIIAASAESEQIEPILDMVCHELAQAFGLPHAAAMLLTEDRSRGYIAAQYPKVSPDNRPTDEPSLIGFNFSIESQPAVRYLIELKAPVSVLDAQTDDLLVSFQPIFQQRHVVSLLALPLIVKGQTVGGIALADVRPRVFAPDEVDLGWRVASQAAGALARVRLAQTQRRLSIALEQAVENVVITDTTGKIVYVNPAFEQVTGYSRAEALGQTLSILKSGKQDDEFYRRLWHTIRSDQVWTGRFVNRKRDGSLYTEEATISPVHNQAGEIVNYVAVKRDVTREVELQEQFRQAQKMEAMGRLAGGIAHDFNNLLTVIEVSTWLLQRQIRPEDPLWESVQRIQETVERATNLIKQLLSFSRHQIIEPQTLTLNQVVGDMGRMLQRIIGEDIRLVTALAPDLWPIHVDPTQVEQVIMNLVINARDAMPDGGTVTIETANVLLDDSYAAYHIGAQPGEHVLLAISDTGVGMSDEIKSHLFEPFFTTKTKGQGTGLGLSTVFGIVNQNGGHILFDSEPGRGTTFRICLPRAPEAKSSAVVGTMPILADGRGVETILVVEDEPAVRELVARVLSAHGYEVLSAADGAEALRQSEERSGPIHLVLTDVVMPEMNGKELVERLRLRRPQVRVVYMSGYTADTIGRQGMLEPGISLVPKPFSLDVLIHKVRSVLDG